MSEFIDYNTGFILSNIITVCAIPFIIKKTIDASKNFEQKYRTIYYYLLYESTKKKKKS